MIKIKKDKDNNKIHRLYRDNRLVGGILIQHPKSDREATMFIEVTPFINEKKRVHW